MKRVFTLLAALLLTCGLSWAQTINWVAADQGYTNAQVIESVDFDDNVSGTFDKGTNNNAPKYYTSGTAIRCYGGNYFTISTDYTLTEIVLGFGSSDGTNAITTDVGTYENGTWTGSASEVTFTIGGTSGNRRIASFDITYSTGGTPSPSITAGNVTIEYDATGGEIAYSINNPVAGTSLTANTESDWLQNLQVGTQTVTFNCDPNQDGAERTATVVLSYGQASKNVTVTQEGNPNVVNTISEITATGNYSVVGTIVAMSTRGYVVGDGTGYVYYYGGSNFSTNYGIGDIVHLNGAVSVYGGVYQFTSTATVTESDDSNYEEENPTILTGADMDARVASTTPPDLSTYVQYEGKLTVSGNYYNITDIEGAGTAQGSISYPTNTTELTALNGKQVKVTGYYVGISSAQYYNTMLESIEEVIPTEPYITIPTTYEFEYSGGGTELEVEVGNFQGTPELSVVFCDADGNVLPNGSDWLTAWIQNNGETSASYGLTLECGTNDASSRTAYLYVTGGDVQSNILAVTQEGNPDVTMTIAEVRAAALGSTVNTQGSVTSCVGTTAYIQDEGAAICVYGVELVEGCLYRVQGVLSEYKGLLEITDPVVEMIADASFIDPEIMTIDFINADYASDNAYQGWFVRIEDATVTAINNQNVTIAQGDATIVVRFATANDITFAVNDILTLNGNIGCFNGPQIANPQDIEVQEDTTPTIVLYNEEMFVEWNFMECNTIEYTIENPVDGAELSATSEEDWITIEYIEDASICFILTENTGSANRVGTITLSYPGAEDKTFTVTQGFEMTVGDWELVDIDDLQEGDVFVIVGTTADGATYAMSNDNGTQNPPTAVPVTVYQNTLTGEIPDNILWNISGTPNGYTIYLNGTTEKWLYCTNGNNGVRVGTNANNNIFTVAEGYLYNNATGRYVGVYNGQDWRCYTNTTGNIAGQTFAYYRNPNYVNITENTTVENPNANTIYHVFDGGVLTLNTVPADWDESHIIIHEGGQLLHNGVVPVTMKKVFLGYDDGSKEGDRWYLATWPFYGKTYHESHPDEYAFPISTDNVVIDGDYDLYMFDEAGDGNGNEWINYKAGGFNTLVLGTGYLLAYSHTFMPFVAGYAPIPTGTNYNVTLSMTPGANLAGWNLVGNPYTAAAFLTDNRAFYVMNDAGSEIIKRTSSNKILPCEGIFVQAASDGEALTFTTTPPTSKAAAINIDLSQNSNLVDAATINFDDQRNLEKFQLNPNHTKVYFSQAGKDYAVINANAMDEMPLNFKAEYDGTYTLRVNTENVEMGYLHLIDNMTGADIDLLANPSYGFEAKTSDYASRFKLVFSANDVDGESNFAFVNNGNIVVNGEGTLQVIDITGRIVRTEEVNGISSVNVNAAGVYVLQLVNGNEVKTQKIVLR